MTSIKKQLNQLQASVTAIQNTLTFPSNNLIQGNISANVIPVYSVLTPRLAAGIFDKIKVNSNTNASVNIEEKITFTALNGKNPIKKRKVVVEIIGSRSAIIFDKPNGTPNRNQASLGATLTIKTNKKGKANVYVFDGTAESFPVKGTLTGAIFLPSATTTVKVS